MSTDLPTAFGQVLRKQRKHLKWSQMKLAIEAEMHLNALGNLERGRHNPSLQTIFVVCKALNVSVAEFMAEVECVALGKSQ